MRAQGDPKHLSAGPEREFPRGKEKTPVKIASMVRGRAILNQTRPCPRGKKSQGKRENQPAAIPGISSYSMADPEEDRGEDSPFKPHQQTKKKKQTRTKGFIYGPIVLSSPLTSTRKAPDHRGEPDRKRKTHITNYIRSVPLGTVPETTRPLPRTA